MQKASSGLNVGLVLGACDILVGESGIHRCAGYIIEPDCRGHEAQGGSLHTDASPDACIRLCKSREL